MTGPRETITILRKAETQDTYGSITTAWHLVLTTRGVFAPLSAGEQAYLDRVVEGVQFELYLDWFACKDYLDEIQHQGRVRRHQQTYEILTVTQYYRKHVVLTLKLVK